MAYRDKLPQTLKVTFPIIGRLSIALSIVLGGSPDVPVAVGVVLGLAGLLEPLVLVTGVVHDQVHDELHPSIVQFVLQHIDV